MVDWLLGALGITKGATIGGFFGAVISLRFISGMSLLSRIFTLLGGTFTAAYVTPLAIHVMGMSHNHDGAIGFLVGVFGMSLAAAMIKEIPSFVELVRERLRRL